jgi:Tol biopolymer transport system component
MLSPRARIIIFWILILGMLVAVALGGCQVSKRVVLQVDGQERIVRTEVRTVRELLAEQGITLDEWDRVEPSLWAELGRSATVRVIRGQEKVQRQPVPFTKEVIKDPALPEGQVRLLQNGQPGTQELVYRVHTYGEQELERQLVQQEVLTAPRPEIMVVGTQSQEAGVPVTGTLAYLANGNAWVVRGDSTERRPVTFSGDLDGRVFDLSHDSQFLLFSRLPSETEDTTAFNALYTVDTRVQQEPAHALGITNVLYAEWSPGGEYLAYSTATRTDGAPGWKAHNDLWIMAREGLTKTQILERDTSGLYGWWGANYAWSPGGRHFAYATPDTVGLVERTSGQRIPLVKFPIFYTYSEWVWVPHLAWSPEGRYLTCVIYAPSLGSAAEPEPRFDLWILDTQGPVQLPLVHDVGMWANPAWSPGWQRNSGPTTAKIAYGVSQLSTYSQYAAYDVYVMDRDGSNKTQVLPADGGAGLRHVEIAWAPDLPQFAYIQGEDLYVVDIRNGTTQRLTDGAICERVDWQE